MGSKVQPPGPARAASARSEPSWYESLPLACAVLFAFGLLQGLTGSFQYSRGVGPVPVAAICFALAIALTCALAGRGMSSAAGAVAPAIGWLLASFVLAMSRPSGSVLITNTAAGQVYLYAGALGAAIGIGIGVSGWTRGRAAGR